MAEILSQIHKTRYNVVGQYHVLFMASPMFYRGYLVLLRVCKPINLQCDLLIFLVFCVRWLVSQKIFPVISVPNLVMCVNHSE